jgi:hypothetical protein
MYYSEFLCTGEQFKNVLIKSIGLHVDVVFASARGILGIRFDIHLIQHLRLFSDHIAQFHNILYRIFVKLASTINITQQIAKKNNTKNTHIFETWSYFRTKLFSKANKYAMFFRGAIFGP